MYVVDKPLPENVATCVLKHVARYVYNLYNYVHVAVILGLDLSKLPSHRENLAIAICTLPRSRLLYNFVCYIYVLT